MPVETITWAKDAVKIIDQTKLPHKLEYIYCRDIKHLWQAIKRLSVRGAPALGAAAAFGVLLGMKGFKGKTREAFDKHIMKVCEYIGRSRPTAVNLFNALEQMREVLTVSPHATIKEIKEELKREAFSIYEDDKQVCREMGDHGAKLIKENDQVLTICNAGALATVDYGTALGVMYSAKRQRKKFKVVACETRPLLQGARLTTWELLKSGIDTTLICDSMAATMMKQGKINRIFTGADRIAANGDTANKIGTYNLAVLANYHKIPFYIVAPKSTFDVGTPDGAQIPIEERDSDEVKSFGTSVTAPKNVKVFNPAFDVTDNKLITGIVTEKGVLKPPFKSKIKKLFA